MQTVDISSMWFLLRCLFMCVVIVYIYYIGWIPPSDIHFQGNHSVWIVLWSNAVTILDIFLIRMKVSKIRYFQRGKTWRQWKNLKKISVKFLKEFVLKIEMSGLLQIKKMIKIIFTTLIWLTIFHQCRSGMNWNDTHIFYWPFFVSVYLFLLLT